jgi:hypothetical protein
LAIVITVTLLAGCAGGYGEQPATSRAPSYADILGTWAGPAYAEGDDVPVNVTMVMTVEAGVLTGNVTVPEQMLDRAPLKELKYEDAMLSCIVDLTDETGYVFPVYVQLTLEDGVFNGTFTSEVVEGVMTLRKQAD